MCLCIQNKLYSIFDGSKYLPKTSDNEYIHFLEPQKYFSKNSITIKLKIYQYENINLYSPL